jgi:transcriptional regulator with XRE-family HTH domain
MNTPKSTRKKTKINAQRKQAFADRLIQGMKDKALLSKRSAFGVDVSWLAKTCKCSSTMAGKYLAGTSFPSQATLEAIGTALSIAPSWLLYGENTAIMFDHILLLEVLKQCYPTVSTVNTPLQYDQIMQFALDIYENIYSLSAPFEKKKSLIAMMLKSHLPHKQKP